MQIKMDAFETPLIVFFFKRQKVRLGERDRQLPSVDSFPTHLQWCGWVRPDCNQQPGTQFRSQVGDRNPIT